MSHLLFYNSEESNFNNKLINENHKSNYNNFRHYSSLIKKNNKNPYNFINASSNIQKNPHKIRYLSTETNDHNNIFSCVNENYPFNNYYKHIQRTPNKYLSINNRVYNGNKNKILSANHTKRIKTNIKKPYQKENEIYLNDFINSSSDEKLQKRIQSSKGFLRKIDFELEQILSNKNKKKLLTINKNYNKENNIDLNFHNNNYLFEYSLDNNSKDKTNSIKKWYFNTINKDKKINKIDYNNNDIEEIKDNYFQYIINDITRKVEFLNTKNDTLSDEITMNLLNNEEHYLYNKLNNFFKDNYSIKKFSKSIFDEKNGNKYLLPLFNDKYIYQNLIDSNRSKNKNKQSPTKTNFNKYKLIEGNELNFNNFKENNRNIIKVFISKKSKEKEKKKINVIFFPSKIEKILPQLDDNKKVHNTSYDKKNAIKINHKRKQKYNEFLINKSQYKYDKNKYKKNKLNKSLNTSLNKENINTLDNFVIENTRITNEKNINNFKPIQTNDDFYKKLKEFKKNHTINISQNWNNKISIDKLNNNKNSPKSKNMQFNNKNKYNDSSNSSKENDISKINKPKIIKD